MIRQLKHEILMNNPLFSQNDNINFYLNPHPMLLIDTNLLLPGRGGGGGGRGGGGGADSFGIKYADHRKLKLNLALSEKLK